MDIRILFLVHTFIHRHIFVYLHYDMTIYTIFTHSVSIAENLHMGCFCTTEL